MASRPPDGAALLVAAHGAFVAADAPALHTLGRIGEALRATGADWQLRRLAATEAMRFAPDRGALKLHLDELAAEPGPAAILVLLGTIVMVDGEPALVTGAQAREYPEDATLPLAWIGERLQIARARHLVAVVSARSDGAGDRATWLPHLATEHASHLIAVGETHDDDHPLVGSLLAALCGDALDPQTGTVTMASLSRYLERQPRTAVQPSQLAATLVEPPPLSALWGAPRAQPRAAQPRSSGAVEDLTGIVLPGQVRIDRVVKGGKFGTVYRAHQIQVDRPVAVKVLHPYIDPASDDGRLFVHEIRSAGRIDHANVVRIHFADVTPDGRLFFAMEWLDGRDLQELGAAGPLPAARAIALTRQLLAGLGAAHAANLVHADVKPANAIVVEPADGAPRGWRTPAPPAGRVVLIDFGLARLRSPGRTAESAGGTLAYMAPEQLQLGRVDARSDLFSAALVLVYLLTGWQRRDAHTLVPPLDTLIADRALRAVLSRALAIEPGQRHGSAAALAAALAAVLTGTPPSADPAIVAPPPPPFRQLAPLTEDDRDRLYGREAEVTALTQRALYQRSVIYTAPSGTGKTSLLRAGLAPRLEALGVRTVYLACRAGCAGALAAAIWPHLPGGEAAPAGGRSVADAITRWHGQRGGKLVVILDQVEAALGDDDFIRDVLGFASWPPAADVAIVLAVREDHLARLLAQAQPLEPGIPVVRLSPLGLAGARAAIIGPLAEARLAIAPDLLDALLGDLERAAAAIGPEMGWGNQPAVFPPHLQLTCAVLYQALAPGEATITLDHYARLGGFAAIVGEHLERVLDRELTVDQRRIASALFSELVTTSHERAMRPEPELIAAIGDAEPVTQVLELLRAHGLVARTRGDDDEPCWELIHDSLVPRVRELLDARDLERRLTIELVRYHLRRSRAGAPSLLGRRELREVARHPTAIAELDAAWARRSPDAPWTPSRLIARSRQVLRRTIGAIAAMACAVTATAAIAIYHDVVDATRRRLDLGRFVLELAPFDWDPVAQRARPVPPADVPLHWELRQWSSEDEDGPPLDPGAVVRGAVELRADARVEHVEAHGGRAFLAISRGRCAPSVVPIRELPGYARRDQAEPVLRIAVPTCAAQLADTIAIPGGAFLYGGVGEPPAPGVKRDPAERDGQRIELAPYRIDRTEVSNAAYRVFGAMARITDLASPQYPSAPELAHAGEDRKPVTGVSWHAARAYCRFLGKDLPTSQQWVKAMRGGESLAGRANPWPRRNLPWGAPPDLVRAQLYAQSADGVRGVADVGSHPGDVSPYGVLDLAGNAHEWTATRGLDDGTRIVRGGSILADSLDSLLVYMAIENRRAESATGQFELGLRCVVNER